MRIISGFHDYYDKIQAAGQDLTLMYHRKNRDEKLEGYQFPMLRDRWSWNKLRPVGVVVGFCGKLYPVIKIPFYTASNSDDVYCYKPEDVRQWVAANLHKKELAEYDSPVRKGRRWTKPAASTRTYIDEFFAEVQEERDKHEDLFIRFDAPIFVADAARWSLSRLEPRPFEINPCLRSIEFYRAVDPYTAFQELAMYLGKQARPEKPIPSIPDKVMVGAKGFNERSFRKDPGKRKPRRK